MILAGDIGGTKALLGLYAARDGQLVEIATRRYDTADFADLHTLLRAFLAGAPERPTAAAFGVPGPVVRGRARATNLSWSIEVSELEAALDLRRVTLANDLVATAAGLLDLPAESLRTLHAGVPHERGARAVLAPGTGLGQAILAWDGCRYHALPSEGGHADFAPRDETQIALLEHELARHGHVSNEHVLAGPGIGRIYDFLRDTRRAEAPASLEAELASSDDRNATIGEAALAARAEIAVETLRLWAAILGAEAGNLALRALALGGVYLGGGIVAKLLPILKEPPFLEAYLAKGRLSELVAKIPVHVILDERAALRGAARLAIDSGTAPR